MRRAARERQAMPWPRDGEADVGVRTQRRPRRVRAALVTALVVDLAVLGADLFLLDGVSATTAVDLDDALVDYRQGVVGTEPATPPTSAPAGGPEVGGPSVEEPDASAATSTSVAGGAGPAGGGTMPAAGAVGPPAEGVYRYLTEGGEKVSVLGAHHDYPATTFAVVRHTGGCGWQIRAEVVREHVDERHLCSGPNQLLQLSQSRVVEFFGSREGATYTCDPPQVQHAPGEAVGATAVTVCSDGESSTATLTRTTLGLEQRQVDGRTVAVVRIRVEGVLRGAYRGTSLDLLTVEAGTGLPVEWERSVDTVADAFGTSVRYQEEARFALVSLDPAR